MRALVHMNVATYIAATKRTEKSSIVRTIVETVRINGGRFLKREGEGWMELNELQAVRRTSLCLCAHARVRWFPCTSTRDRIDIACLDPFPS
jgi:hypothetical protein